MNPRILLQAAERTAGDETASAAERAQMLMELAMGLQSRPKTIEHYEVAIELYERALGLCPSEDCLLAARIAARKASALQAMPSAGLDTTQQAREVFETVIPVLARLGSAAEAAEAEMNLGLCLQELAGTGRARMVDAIAAYQRALRTFDATGYPVEFALLQNNLATALLAMGSGDGKADLREAVALQCLERGLRGLSLSQHPAEYATLQNNLGNALQSIASSHPVENHERALAAYDEALKVRTREARPLEYGNTLANKANCLWNLGRVEEAKACYAEARELFEALGELDKARAVSEAMQES